MFDLFGESPSGAKFSRCGAYRYKLWRQWDPKKDWLIFIMLNPSTADATENDPTVERCQRRALEGNFGGLIVVNLMAYRATNPQELKPLEREERIGRANILALEWALEQPGLVICGWGKWGALGPVEWLNGHAKRVGVPLYCLMENRDGSPRHPLYVPYDAKPIWWGGANPDE